MKKLICVILSLVMIASLFVPAFAEINVSKYGSVPVIVISGDGAPLEDKDGNRILCYRDLLNGGSGSEDDARMEEIWKSVANVMYPFLMEGILMDKWDNYYEKLQQEVGEIFGESLLDKNGEVSNGSGLAKYKKDQVEYFRNRDAKDDKGYYDVWDYTYSYDWRLDPLVNADKFNEYIKDVKKVTGAEKVGVLSQCLGTAVIMAYVSKYGTDDLCGISFNGGIVNGSETLSEAISGKFKVDGDAINRMVSDFIGVGAINVDPFVTASIDLLVKSGVLGTVTDAVKNTIYEKIVEGVTSAIALSTFYTFPSYWAGVREEDFETAKEYVFGKEGSEKREEYAGLIAKIDNYDKVVRDNLPELFKEINDNINLCIMSKYGFQLAPICESRDAVADQFASVKYSSVGATTSTVYDTLSEDYINGRISEGKGKYISPDKQIDASTCMFPENTWFLKGSSHSNWSDPEEAVCYTVVTADRQLTVDDLPYSQFMVYSYETNSISKMTEDNCDTYHWEADEEYDHPSTKHDKLFSFLKSLFKWLGSAFRLIFDKIKAE